MDNREKLFREMFDPDLFMSYMVSIDEMNQDEVDNLPYHIMCFQECHCACAWMIREVMENYIDNIDINSLFMVTGSFKPHDIFFAGCLPREHSWMEYRNATKVTVIDMTAAQFLTRTERLYIGEKLDRYEEHESVCIADTNRICEHLEVVGY